ncbi:hypothetical protein ABT174_33570 [Streptomyces sparsogenes]|uniref:hypothetical protein n=1 Tax=Streptomyces sparsogenes TaxID=67365 RepID=UPI0033320671
MSIRILTWTRLTDGRPQLWAMTDQNKLVSKWQLSGTDADPKWADWSPFPAPTGIIRTLMGANLHDGRPQLWAVTTELGVFTVQKVTTNPDAAWSSWTKFDSP